VGGGGASGWVCAGAGDSDEARAVLGTGVLGAEVPEVALGVMPVRLPGSLEPCSETSCGVRVEERCVAGAAPDAPPPA
jgi:hypothetical protein